MYRIGCVKWGLCVLVYGAREWLSSSRSWPDVDGGVDCWLDDEQLPPAVSQGDSRSVVTSTAPSLSAFPVNLNPSPAWKWRRDLSCPRTRCTLSEAAMSTPAHLRGRGRGRGLAASGPGLPKASPVVGGRGRGPMVSTPKVSTAISPEREMAAPSMGGGEAQSDVEEEEEVLQRATEAYRHALGGGKRGLGGLHHSVGWALILPGVEK